MKKMAKMISFILIVIMAVSCTTAVSFAGSSTTKVKVYTKQDYKQVQQTLKLINKQRSKRGLRKLKLDKTLCNNAVQRAAEVAIYVPVTSPHKRPSGKSAKSINSRISYECCAEGYETPSDVVTGWMHSPPHKKGILLRSARSIGIAAVTTSGEDRYWVLEFSNSGVKKAVKKKSGTVKKTKTVKAKKKYIKKSRFKLSTTDPSWYSETATVAPGKSIKMYPWYRCMQIDLGTMAKLNPSSFKWKSSKPSVASVSKTGKIKGKKKGTVTIKATFKGSPKFTLKKKVKVTEEDDYWY